MAERHYGGYGQEYPEDYRRRHEDEQRERYRSGAGRYRDDDDAIPRNVSQSREDFRDMEYGRSQRFGSGGMSGGGQQRRDDRDYEREQDYRWSGGGRSFDEPHRSSGQQRGREHEQQWSRDFPRDPSRMGSSGDYGRGYGENEGRPYEGGYQRGGSRFEPQGSGIGGFGRLGSFGRSQENAWGDGWESGERGRSQGHQQGRHAGRGPRGYQRSDERIREDVCDALTADPFVDASEVSITVQNGDVTLEGSVDDRQAKRRAE